MTDKSIEKMTKPELVEYIQTGPERETIDQSIVRVSAGIGAIGKEKQADMGTYKYQFRGIDDVLDALHPVLIEVGVTITPQVQEIVTVNDGVYLTIDYRIANIHGDSVYATFVGEGRDRGDKAAQKAQSNAYKYMAFQTFCIPVQADDSDSVQYTQEPVVDPKELLLRQVKDHAWKLNEGLEKEHRVEESKLLVEQEVAAYGRNPDDEADVAAIIAQMDAIYEAKEADDEEGYS